MNERDDELLKRYRDLPRAAPRSALDASILAASRRAARRPVARWAAPFSIAAVLVLALGLVLKVQREAPEATRPSSPQERPMPGTNAPAAPSIDAAKDEAAQAPASVQQEQAVVTPPKAEQKPAAARAQSSARMAAAPAAAAKEAAAPELRELERIARLRAGGRDDEADAALEAFRRAHPGYRIEPAMWEKVRRH